MELSFSGVTFYMECSCGRGKVLNNFFLNLFSCDLKSALLKYVVWIPKCNACYKTGEEIRFLIRKIAGDVILASKGLKIIINNNNNNPIKRKSGLTGGEKNSKEKVQMGVQGYRKSERRASPCRDSQGRISILKEI